MTTPSLCSCCRKQPHDNWQDGAGGYLCQDCWEIASDAMWWEMLRNMEWPDLETVPEGADVFAGEPISGLPEER